MPTDIDVTIGNIVQQPGELEWTAARAEHIYIYPERVNWLPNPSFEEVGNFGWRSDGAITRTTPGIDAPGNHFLHVAGTTLEGIPIPIRATPWRISAYFRQGTGTGTTIRVELGCWEETYTIESMVAGRDQPLTEGWIRYDWILTPYDATVGVSPRFVSDGSFDIDLALCEQTLALHDYFDGDSQTGIVGDFSWHGVSHQSYSLWYNNKYETGARLFGQYIDGQVFPKGLVWDYVPEGATLYTHWDVLDPLDTGHPLKDWSSRTMP